ncbi:unnamed protein product [marine sediment metagenome]|uniref:Uncharacterized protein n=1 Tax=marine sediment metagenome TaxID=412755 RepID=X1EQ20_9ZZZZ
MFAKLFEWVALLHGGGKTPEQVCQEWHSFLIGFAEAFCLFIPSMFPQTTHAHCEMKEEFHYYGIGRAGGVLAWVLILIGIFK